MTTLSPIYRGLLRVQSLFTDKIADFGTNYRFFNFHLKYYFLTMNHEKQKGKNSRVMN